MSMYAAKEPDEHRTRLADVLRKQRAERVDADMLARLQREQRVARIDKKLAELHEMMESTSHERLKQLLATALTKLSTVREHITC
jgi:hypothetical protein